MRVEAGVTPYWDQYHVYDRFDGKEIRDCVMADEEKREVTHYIRDKQGHIMTRGYEAITVTRKCWVRIVRVEPLV